MTGDRTSTMDTDVSTDQFLPLNRAPLVLALILALTMVIAVLVGARVFYDRVARQPVAMSTIDSPDASSPECSTLTDPPPHRHCRARPRRCRRLVLQLDGKHHSALRGLAAVAVHHSFSHHRCRREYLASCGRRHPGCQPGNLVFREPPPYRGSYNHPRSSGQSRQPC